MRLFKKRLSMLVIILMIITMISPVSSANKAETATSENFSKTRAEIVTSDNSNKEGSETETLGNLREMTETGGAGNPDEESAKEDEVTYNLGSQEIIVGHDAELAGDIPFGYKLFDENNNYTIQLEDNAFFPYEVQFKYNDTIFVEWFDTPDSTVRVGEHIFSVYSEMNDDTRLSQIGVWIDGEYVAARPYSKNFTNPMFRPFTLLPLEVVEVSLDLTSYNYFQLKNVKVAAVLAGLTPEQNIGDDAKVVWKCYSGDDYEIVEQDDTIDLSEISRDSFILEFIVGSALQIDYDNIRYIVNVTKSDKDVIVDNVDIYKKVDGKRSKVEPINVNRYVGISDSYDEYIYNHLTKIDISADTLYIGLKLNSAYDSFDNIKAYKGSFSTAEDAEAAAEDDLDVDVTDELLNQDIEEDEAGLAFNLKPHSLQYSQIFTLVFGNDGGKNVYRIQLYIGSNNYVYAHGSLYAMDSTYSNIVTSSVQTWSSDHEVEVYTYILEQGYAADAEHCLRLEYVYGGRISVDNRSYIDKAVLGHFDTLEDASGENDIKDQLFPASMYIANSGYIANYSGDGQDFTVFAEGEVHKLTIKAVDAADAEFEELLPNPGSSDTYFRVNGADEIFGAYILPYEHDTYYDIGYQTVFYLDDVGLSSLKPVFWKGNDRINVYSGHSGAAGILQVSGETEVDFSKGAVQYAVAAEDGMGLKNYWVTFVKKNEGGAKLFVNGINGDDGPKREVFLTSRHNNAHDIFIANVGDEELTELNATLIDEQNIKLDPYWTVGSGNKDILKAFNSVQKLSYGELDNVAKIRLIPDGEGEISGTLKITAKDQEDVVITLTGHAGDPRLTTQDIPDAVKYVPYAIQILHNNKYNWNKVTLDKISGSLPEGIILKPNGELYGVPTETGEFTFRIQMRNSDPRFRDSTATYTLVVEDNTNYNVDRSTDEGYEITKRVGKRIGNDDVITTIADHEFITDGERNEFIDFWLNGEKLVKDIDYIEDDGSTKITIRSQTFRNKASRNSVNTIAAEFRIDGDEDKELKRAAQNFKIDIGVQSGDSSGGSSGSDTSTPKPKPEPTSEPEPVPDPTIEEIIIAPEPVVNVVETRAIVKGTMAETAIPIEKLEEALSSIFDKAGEIEADNPVVIELVVTRLTDGVMSIDTFVPAKFIRDISGLNNNISLKINAKHIGTVILNNKAINFMAKNNGDVIGISVSRNGNKVSVNVNMDNLTLSKVDGGIRIILPNMAHGETIILFKADGGKKIVKKSVIENSDVYALLEGSGIVEVINNSKDFDDVEVTDWFYDSVLFVNSRELFIGTSETEFAPNLPITRAMIATVLHRLEDNENSKLDNSHNDADSGQWYSDSISWVTEVDIMSGYGNGTFGINDVLSREQLAAVMYNYANYIGLNTIERGKVQQFRDIDQTSSWAYDSIRWAVGTGLIQGHNNNLNPKDGATRAEVATIIKRFIDVLVK